MRVALDYSADAYLAAKASRGLTLQQVLTDPRWFGLDASPLQRALCEWADGRPANDVAIDASGYADDIAERMTLPWVVGPVPTTRPREVYLLAGIRCGKSLLAAALAVYASQTVDVSRLRPGERARVSVVSLDKDKAGAVIMHLKGALVRPAIAPLVVAERATGVDLRHPSGTIIEVVVAAGKRAGGGLVSYWSAGVIFDEAPRMQGEADGVVNFEDSRKAVLGRLLPGAQLWAIGSPWAPLGPVHATVTELHRKPGDVLCVRAPAPALNPVTWTPSACEQQRADEDVFRMDVLGEWGRPESSPIHDGILGPCLRPDGDLKPDPLHHYEARMDPAGRTNAWTLGIGTLDRNGVRQVVALRSWRPGANGVNPTTILTEIRDLCATYRVSVVTTDQWAVEPLQELARPLGLELSPSPATAATNHDMYAGLVELLKSKAIVLPEDRMALEDLRRVKRRLTASGGIQWVLPVTHDGRHCDYAPVIAGLAVCVMSPPDEAPARALTTDEREAAYKERLLEQVRKRREDPSDEFDFDREPIWGEADDEDDNNELLERLSA